MKKRITLLISITLLLTTVSVYAQENTTKGQIKQQSSMSFIKALQQEKEKQSKNNETQTPDVDNTEVDFSEPCVVKLIGDFFANASYKLYRELPLEDIYEHLQNCDDLDIEGHTSKAYNGNNNNNNERLSFDRALEISKELRKEWTRNGDIVSILPSTDNLGNYATTNNRTNIGWPKKRNTISSPIANNSTVTFRISGVGDREAKFSRPEDEDSLSEEEIAKNRLLEAQDRKIIIRGTAKN